jgi:uncharacterized RDD family membrane protein YckC/tetratricopeptide (TPR) repeat protein
LVAGPGGQVNLQNGSRLLRTTARTFLGLGILNIVAGIILTAMGWIPAIFCIVVGILELINARIYWSSPPTSISRPIYVAVLEIISGVVGSLWSLIGGIANLIRLRSPEVKAYLAALQAGVTVPAEAAAGPPLDQFKRCPMCAETIRLEALVCRFCNHQFNEDEVKAAQEQARMHLAASQLEALRAQRPRSPYAGFWRRFAAMLIDVTILAVFWFLADMLVVAMFYPFTHVPPAAETTGPIFAVLLVIFFCLYFPLFESSKKQATWGKMALGVVVTGLDGKRISFARALARTLAKILSGLPFYLGYIIAAFTGKKQALHDFIASTLVVLRDFDQSAPVQASGIPPQATHPPIPQQSSVGEAQRPRDGSNMAVKDSGVRSVGTPQVQAEAGKGRRGDGTILGDVISKGVYKPRAGSETIGYFNPEIAPFRNFPNGKTGLLQGNMADLLIQTIPASRQLYGPMFKQSGDTAVDLAIKLGLSSTRQVLDTFLQLVKREAVSEFLLVTTTMPFFLTYSTGSVIVLAEVDHELKLNALAHLLLKDQGFSSVHSVSDFEAKAISLMQDRKQEVEEKKQWAIDFQKSRNIPSIPARPPSVGNSMAPAVTPSAEIGLDNGTVSNWNPPALVQSDEYERRCLTAEFHEQTEARTYRSDSAFAEVLEALNGRRFDEAIQRGTSLFPRYRDLDLPWYWVSSAYLDSGQLDKAYRVALDGLARANRKSLLLTRLGDIDWQRGNLAEAVYALSQVLHCYADHPPEYNAYLLLSYVAEGYGLTNVAATYLRKVDQLRAGTIRLNAALANRLRGLSRRTQAPAIARVVEGLSAKYLANVKADGDGQHQPMPETTGKTPGQSNKPLTVGELFDGVMRDARQKMSNDECRQLSETLVELCKNKFAVAEIQKALNHPNPNVRAGCETFIKKILVEEK